MGYIVKADFTAFTPSTTIADSELNEIIERASDVIDSLTMYKIVNAGGLNNFPAFTQTLVKKAVCAQVMYMFNNGYKGDATVSNVSIGSFSYTSGTAENQSDKVNKLDLAPYVRGYLLPTGLLYRGVMFYDDKTNTT